VKTDLQVSKIKIDYFIISDNVIIILKKDNPKCYKEGKITINLYDND
jgi:hypothetical protein